MYHYFFKLLQQGTTFEQSYNQFLIVREYVVVKLLYFALKAVPGVVEWVKLGEKVSAYIKESLENSRVLADPLEVFLNGEVDT